MLTFQLYVLIFFIFPLNTFCCNEIFDCYFNTTKDQPFIATISECDGYGNIDCTLGCVNSDWAFDVYLNGNYFSSFNSILNTDTYYGIYITEISFNSTKKDNHSCYCTIEGTFNKKTNIIKPKLKTNLIGSCNIPFSKE